MAPIRRKYEGDLGLKYRRYDIDWLRTVGSLLVVPFHTLIMFNMNPWSIVYVKDTVNVPLFNILDSVIDRFHMPLLFVLAGMSACCALKVRTPKQFIDERFKKLFVPAAFGCIALNPIMTYIHQVSAGNTIDFPQHCLNFFTKDPGDLTGIGGGFTPAHLWFILYLFVFSLICLPVFSRLDNKASEGFLNRLASVLCRPLMLMLLVLPVPFIAMTDILGYRNPLVYLFMFISGYLFGASEGYQKALNRDKWFYLAIGILLIYIKFYAGINTGIAGLNIVLAGLLDKAARLIPVYALLGLANCYMNRGSPVLKYLSKASFPVYVIHMLFNTAAGFYILPLKIGVGVKYLLIVAITFALSFLFYEIIKRVKVLKIIFAVK